ncbi:MAG: DUF3808 domain-containing protein [Ignavibacteriales bacterium]|nr:MAG: DUF3808 domain-containing protein [Ignavibacteriales bacterium]
MKLHSLTLLILVLLIAFTNNETAAQRDINSTVKRGLELAYQFNWDDAEKVFKGLISKYPERPEPYHYYSGIFLWYFLSSNDETDLDSFTDYSDLAIEKGKELLDENPEDINLIYILGANYNYRAIAFARAENYLDAIWASKKSESYLREVLSKDPENADAYLGLGLYSFSVSQVPSAFSWALDLAGIKGSIEEGLDNIRKAAEHGEFSKVEAQYYLSQILSGVVFDFEEASVNLTKLSKRYPENLVFNYSLAVIDIKNRKLDAAEKILIPIVKSNENKFRKVIAFSNFLLGDVSYKKNQFDKAISYYENFLKLTPDKDYTAIASFRLGVCYEFSNEREKAVENFSNCGNGNMDLEDDVYAKRKGSVYQKRTIAESESSLIRFANMIDNNKHKAALDSLSQLLKSVKTEKLKSEIYFYMSEAAYLAGKYSESALYAESSISSNHSEERWLNPFSHYNAARAYHHMNQPVKRDDHLGLAEDNNDFDYQSVLKNLVYVLRRESKNL